METIKGNIVFGVIIIIFAAVFYLQTGDFPAEARLLPRLVLVGLMVTGGLMIIDAVIKQKKGVQEGGSKITKNSLIYQILIPGFMMLGAYLVLRLFGFFVASFVLVAVLFFYQTYQSYGTTINKRHFAKGVIVATVITAVMYIVFSVLLGLPTPDGEII